MTCMTTNGPTATAPVIAEEAAVPSTSTSAEAKALVDKILAEIKDSDAGLSMPPARQYEVDGYIRRLEEIGARQQPRPLDNPLLWGNYTVAYTSTGKDQLGQPAGGRFRGRIGRTLFQTAGLYQSVLLPDVATNKVEFKLFGLIPGYVGLRGKVLPQGDTGDRVKVLFEPSSICIGGLHVRIGPPSSVELTTTYLDERVRLGKGSRGSLFVFARDPAADAAGMDRVGLDKTSPGAMMAFVGFMAALVASGGLLWLSGHPLLKAAGALVWLLGAGMATVVRQGGSMMDEYDRAQTKELMEKEAAAKPMAA